MKDSTDYVNIYEYESNGLHKIVLEKKFLCSINNSLKFFYNKQHQNIQIISKILVIIVSNIINCIRKTFIKNLKSKITNFHYKKVTSKATKGYLISKTNVDIKKQIKLFNIYKKKNKLLKIQHKKTEPNLYKSNETKEKKINLCIAKYCFIKCKGCYNIFCNKPEISYREIKDFLKYAKSKGLVKVTLSGGDPLTRKDLKKIIKECNKLKLIINLDTVGLTFTKSRIVPATGKKIKKFSNLNFLKKINYVGIPLDGSNNDIISTFRIYKGNLFNEIIKELELFDKQNINVCINTVLHKQNINDFKNIYSILIKHKCVIKWQIFQFMPIGPLGSKNANLYKIDSNEFQKIKNQIEDLNKNGKITINIKSSKERSHNYMLVNSNGLAYKIDLNNNIEKFGKISNKDTWDNILNNLF